VTSAEGERANNREVGKEEMRYSLGRCKHRNAGIETKGDDMAETLIGQGHSVRTFGRLGEEAGGLLHREG